MREIKFRGYNEPTKEFVYGYYSKDDEGHHWINKDDEIHYFIRNTQSIGQYTGLKDKNGKEIYEGDIVSTDLSRPYLIVEFRNGAFMYQCHHGGQDFYDHMEPAFEDEREYTKYHAVIGNIYENPELLK